jgi:RNA polymerase sigma-70 factor (ECF subfamily)
LSLNVQTTKFESAVLEHLDAGHNLARWLLRNEQDAQDVVQESCVKALRAFDTFRGGDFRVWFLTIIRNTSFTWMRRNRNPGGHGVTQDVDAGPDIAADAHAYDPLAIAIRAADAHRVRRAIEALPDSLRETLVLREMEGLSYKEIGNIVDVPIGTVMSRLARGRAILHNLLVEMDQSLPHKSVQEGAP